MDNQTLYDTSVTYWEDVARRDQEIRDEFVKRLSNIKDEVKHKSEDFSSSYMLDTLVTYYLFTLLQDAKEKIRLAYIQFATRYINNVLNSPDEVLFDPSVVPPEQLFNKVLLFGNTFDTWVARYVEKFTRELQSNVALELYGNDLTDVPLTLAISAMALQRAVTRAFKSRQQIANLHGLMSAMLFRSLNVYSATTLGKSELITRYMIIGVLDDTQCSFCRNLHGSVHRLVNSVPTGPVPTFHNRCRCYPVPLIKGPLPVIGKMR